MMARIALIALCLLTLHSGSARAHFLDDPDTFNLGVSVLRGALGAHPRVLRIEAARDGISIEAQDPANRSHIDRWRYGTVTYFGVLSMKRLTGPQAVNPTLINHDLEANLFDLDSVDLAATAKLLKDAVGRARLEDPAVVTRIEIQRQLFLIPRPTSGDVRWTLYVDSGRERASIHANAGGTITGADLSGTHRAENLDILGSPELVPQAIADFRTLIGAQRNLVRVGIERKIVAFHTNTRDPTLGQIGFNQPSFAIYTWDLNGLQQRLGRIDIDAAKNAPANAFSVDDVDWSIVGRLARDAQARAAIPNARITNIGVEKSSDQPGGAVLAWTVELTEPSGERTTVVADLKGTIARVVLPESRRPKLNWLDAATIAEAIARVPAVFGNDAKIASLVFDDRGARVTVEDAARGGQPATFNFSANGVTRAAISFSLDAMGPRFATSDLTVLDAKRLGALQEEAMKRLTNGKPAYLESVTIGAHPFVRKAGARAIEVRLRDRAQDSAQAQYAWIVFDFAGRPLDMSKF
ncbi:MAG TPA: hypothetical protein VFB45_26685 [Pseudolabrys sp.]|nr:hypothetical protein [Pseudolabrys sp.]